MSGNLFLEGSLQGCIALLQCSAERGESVGVLGQLARKSRHIEDVGFTPIGEMAQELDGRGRSDRVSRWRRDIR